MIPTNLKLLNTIGALTIILGGLPHPVLADYSQGGGMKSTDCFKKVYREEYIPGTGPSNPGRVRKYYERQRVPCQSYGRAQKSVKQTHRPTTPSDDNSCIEGSIIGGIAGGAAGGTLATKKNWIWSIPAGIIGGAMIGCQVDGG